MTHTHIYTHTHTHTHTQWHRARIHLHILHAGPDSRWDDEAGDKKDASKQETAADAALPTRFEAQDSWGEAHAKERCPRLFIMEWQSGSVVEALKVGSSVGHASAACRWLAVDSRSFVPTTAACRPLPHPAPR